MNVALVLSSGGARGLAHIGAIEELEAHGHKITSICGTSMGALVGGMYACGQLDVYRKWMKTIDRRRMFSLLDLSFSLNHIVKGDRIIEAMKQIVPDVNIEKLPIPYTSIATDWLNGQEIIFSKGSLYDAIRASISIPALFSPVHRDDMILIDGGIINPLPLNRVVRTEGDILVGVDVNWIDYHEINERKKHEEELQRQEDEKKGKTHRMVNYITDKIMPNVDYTYFSLIDRAMSIQLRRNSLLMKELQKPDVFVDMKFSEYDGSDYDKSEQLIAYGRKCMNKALNDANL